MAESLRKRTLYMRLNGSVCNPVYVVRQCRFLRLREAVHVRWDCSDVVFCQIVQIPEFGIATVAHQPYKFVTAFSWLSLRFPLPSTDEFSETGETHLWSAKNYFRLLNEQLLSDSVASPDGIFG